MLVKPYDLLEKIKAISKLTTEKLPKVGRIQAINDHYSVMPKNTTLLTGYPSSGKSYLLLNFQMSLSRNRGYKHVIFTPEMGDPEWIVLTLVEIYAGIPARDMKAMQLMNSLNWITDHFRIIKCDNAPVLKDIDKAITEARESMERVDTFSIDNLNDMNHVISGNYDAYYEPWMVEFNKIAERQNVHGFLTAHPLTTGEIDTSKPPPPNRIKGGGAFWNKGYNILSLSRDNDYCQITFFKIKPRIVGKFGTIDFQVDFRRNTYFKYEQGRANYLFEQEGHPENYGKQPDLPLQTSSYEKPAF